jgi:hypothetical protein
VTDVQFPVGLTCHDSRWAEELPHIPSAMKRSRGQILISLRVLTKVGNAVKVEPVGEFALKGIRRPLAPYNVIAAIALTRLTRLVLTFSKKALLIGQQDDRASCPLLYILPPMPAPRAVEGAEQK